MTESSQERIGGNLLLLTHQYPFDTGDAAFIRNEIAALAATFERVSIVSLTAPSAPRLPLPQNVQYLGAVGSITPLRALLGLVHPARAFRAIRIFAHEGWHRTPKEMQKDLVAAASGAWFASRAFVDATVRTHDQLTVYSFWGVDIAYLLPWLRPRARRIAVRVHRYDMDIETAGYRPLRRAILGDADIVLTIAESGQNYILERYPYVLRSNVVVRRLGIAEQPAPRDSTAREGAMQVVSCSSVIPLKRVDLILKALTAIAGDGRQVHWTHFGDGPLLEELQLAADRATNASPQLRVSLAGRVSRDQVLTFYRDSRVDAFINLSTVEGIPVSAIEAAAFGIPIVATDVGSTRELVGEALGSGILVDVDDDPLVIARAIVDVVNHPERFAPKTVWAERFDAARNSVEAAKSVLGG